LKEKDPCSATNRVGSKGPPARPTSGYILLVFSIIVSSDSLAVVGVVQGDCMVV
jgi:hypothetical protein